MMAQNHIQTSVPRNSGFYEIPQENAIARIQARMLKMKHAILGSAERLNESDRSTSQKMAGLETQEARDEAYDAWLLEILRTSAVEYERQLIEANLLVMQDHLTGIGNRRYFEDQIVKMTSEIERSQYNRENGKPYKPTSISLIALDIDHFKAINDTLGHAMGDAALKEFTDIIDSMHRPYDTFARLGGEEFVIMMTDTSKKDAVKKAEIIRKKVQGEFKKRLLTHCKTEQERSAVVLLAGTVSVGVATYSTEDQKLSSKEFVKQADDALYHSKHTGRNKVTEYGSMTEKSGEGD